jgi:hypothetical protein
MDSRINSELGSEIGSGMNQEKSNNNIVKPNIDKTEQQSQQQQNKNTQQKHISSQINDTMTNIEFTFKHSHDEYGVNVDMLFNTRNN